MTEPTATCRQLRDRVGGERDLSVRSVEARAHLATCPDCRSWLDDMSALRSMMVELPAPALPDGFEAALRQRLDEAVVPAAAAVPAGGGVAAGGTAAAGARPSPGWLARLRAMLTPPRLVVAGTGLAMAAAAVMVIAPPAPSPAVLELQLSGAAVDQPVSVRLDLPEGVYSVASPGHARAWTEPDGGPVRVELSAEGGEGGPVHVHVEQDGRVADVELLAHAERADSLVPPLFGARRSVLTLSPSPTAPPGADGLIHPEARTPGDSARQLEDTMTRSVRSLSLVVALAAAGPAVAGPGHEASMDHDPAASMDSTPVEHVDDMTDMHGLSESTGPGHDATDEHLGVGDAMEMDDHDAMLEMMEHARGMDEESMDHDGMDDMRGGHGMADAMSDHDGDAMDPDDMADEYGHEGTHDDMHDDMDDAMHDAMHDDMTDACDMDEMGDMMGEGGMMDHMDEDMMDHMGDDGMMGGGSDGMGGGSDGMGGGSDGMGGGSDGMGGGR